jgi:hypothetical protein
MTLRDLAIAYGTGGVPDTLINLLSQQNSLLQDMPWKAGNLETGHKFRVTAGLPGVSYRSINEGVLPSRSTQKIVTETCSLIEAVSEIDKELVDIATNKELFRAEESVAFLESMARKVSVETFYGTRAADYRGIMGLSERYSKLTGLAANNIIDAGGTGDDNASIWCICWGDRGVIGIYPKNTKAGLEHSASGVVDLEDPDQPGATYQGYRDRFKWRVGLALMDYRQVVRIANIDVPKLATFDTAADTSADLLKLMAMATERVNNLELGNCVFYMHRKVREAFKMQLMKKQNLALTLDAATSKPVMAFEGKPIKVDDNLLLTEERVQ